MQRRIPDTTKIREAIGWVPQKTLDDIIVDVKEDQLTNSRLDLLAA